MTSMTLPERTARIDALRAQIMARKGSFPVNENPLARAAALWRAARPGAARTPRSRVQVRAAYLHELVKRAAIEVESGWTLAGNHLPTAHLGVELPDADNPEHVRQMAALEVEPGHFAAVREAARPWREQLRWATGEAVEGLQEGRGGWGDADTHTVYWANGWIENHSIRDYAKVLRLGFGGIRREMEAHLASADPADPEYPQKENFWGAARDVCDAGILLGQRYAEQATALVAQTEDPAQRLRLERIATTCRRVPGEGARTLHEAVQSLWLAHLLTCGEDGINANSIGRLDQILLPYYEADVAAGRITDEQTVELMEELACRLYLDYDVQAITLGGVDAAGEDATNNLTHLILEATDKVEFARDVSLRLSSKSPPALVSHAATLIARGGGIPFLFNDECFIPALAEHGISLQDARDYAPIGCIELTIPGRANPHAVSGWFNSTKCLELALFNGRDPGSGQQLGPCTGELAELTCFEDLYGAYQTQVDYFARRMVYWCNRGELEQREQGPLPCWSTLTDDCLARGRDITDGGAVYDYHSICLLGTANTADGLMALKKLLFEERSLTADQLLVALTANFQEHQSIRQMLLHGAPKFGNDNGDVDELARRVDEDFIDLMDRQRSSLGGRYVVHLFSFRCNIDFGHTLGATPDGRSAGEPLAYSLSAHQGRDVQGVTALLNSIARLPHRRAAGATAAIVELDPALVEGEAGVERLAQLIHTAMELGVGQLQWNVCTVERLLQAQDDPEHYGNLTVRVAGYSQKFNLIPRELQDHIIARTKHRQ
ncbi:MAG: hypothetical protein HOH74_22235 [Gemmatimonadetes bacterium]|nr:hypothetical protein [Gemmatimonadota bacterium]